MVRTDVSVVHPLAYVTSNICSLLTVAVVQGHFELLIVYFSGSVLRWTHALSKQDKIYVNVVQKRYRIYNTLVETATANCVTNIYKQGTSLV